MARRTKRGDAKVAVAYVRVSTDRQELGPEAQRTAIEAFCAAHGIRLADVFVDATSGATPLDQRPGFTAALAALRTHGAGLLLIAKRDRLARDIVVAALAERAVAAAGAQIASADGAGNGTSDADAFMRGVLDAASAYERALIRSRTRAALAAKAARGERTGGVPYGFRDEGGRLVEEPGERLVIERVRALRAEELSYARIARQLAADGHKPRSGQRWHETQIRRMLSTPSPLESRRARRSSRPLGSCRDRRRSGVADAPGAQGTTCSRAGARRPSSGERCADRRYPTHPT